jgi:hypothetical protein
MAVYTIGVKHLLGRILQHAVIEFAGLSTTHGLGVLVRVLLLILPVVCSNSFFVFLDILMASCGKGLFVLLAVLPLVCITILAVLGAVLLVDYALTDLANILTTILGVDVFMIIG